MILFYKVTRLLVFIGILFLLNHKSIGQTVDANIALNKTVTVSSLESNSYPASNAVDGNTTTRWSSAYSDPQWIYVDLGASYDINRVKITWENAYGKDYLIQTSTDAVNWTTIKTVTGNTVLVNDNTSLSGNGRYVRMYGTARGTTYGYSIYEFEVYGLRVCDIAAYSGVSDTGNQNYTQRIGLRFKVNSPIKITSLGAFDDLQNGLSLPITVGIIRNSDSVTVAGPITLSGSTDPLIYKYRMHAITGVELAVGTYTVVAVGYGTGERNGNSTIGTYPASILDSANGFISFDSSGYGGSGFGLPTTSYPIKNTFHAGTFKFCYADTKNVDYFRTIRTGNWNANTSWESSFDNKYWHPATTFPYWQANDVTLQSPHIITLTANLTANQLFINSGATLSINAGDTLFIQHGPGFDITVNGTLNIASTGNMTMESSASRGTACMGVSPGTINGNITVERYIPASNLRGWRYLSSSVNSPLSIHANWQEGATFRTNNPKPTYGTHITGSTVDQTNGFDGTNTGQSSLYTYDIVSNSYKPIANTNVLSLSATTPYLLYFRGDRAINLDSSTTGQGSTNTTLRATGTIVQGTQSFSTNMVGNGNVNGGFNLIANPYPAPISWSSIYSANSNITPYYTYYDNRIAGGSFVTVSNTGVKSNISSNATVDIQSGEAFWVQASTTTSPVLTITESQKTSNSKIDVFKAKSISQQLYTSLYVSDSLGRRNVDGVLNTFDASYNNDVDINDADELENFNENIAIKRKDHHLSIESRNFSNQGQDTIPIYMSNMNKKNYDFQFDISNLSQSVASIFLVDKYLNIKSKINLDTITIVPFSITSDAGSNDSSRFYILLNPANALPVKIVSFLAKKNTSSVELQWESKFEENYTEYQIERASTVDAGFSKIGRIISTRENQDGIYKFLDSLPNQGKNLYRLKIISKDGGFTYSNIIEIDFIKTKSTITISPNPIQQNKLNINISNLPKGVYLITIIDRSGRLMYSQEYKHDGSSLTKTVILSKEFTKGIYVLKFGNYAQNIFL